MNVHSKLIDLFKSQQDLTQKTVSEFIDFLANSDTHEIDLATVTAAWKVKGYKSSELALIAKYIREKYLDILDLPGEKVFDCCGTGGDSAQTFNISTTCAFILSKMEVKVAKHGGRKTTSACGSIDFLEAMGIETLTEKSKIEENLKTQNLAFIASPALQKLLGRWKQVCSKLEFHGQTGLIGTLTNPVNLTHQLLGVSKREWGELMSNALLELGRERAMVVFGAPQLDEVSVCGETEIWEIENKQIKNYKINSEDYGIKKSSLDNLRGGDGKYNADIFRDLMSGNTKKHQAIWDAIVLNSAVSLKLLDKASSIKEGIDKIKNLNMEKLL